VDDSIPQDELAFRQIVNQLLAELRILTAKLAADSGSALEYEPGEGPRDDSRG